MPCARAIEKNFQSLVQFGEQFRMKLDDKQSVKTSMGSFCSFILLIIVTAYAYIKVDVFINKKDVEIMSSRQMRHFSPDYVFDYSQGLNFAFAFTAYD